MHDAFAESFAQKYVCAVFIRMSAQFLQRHSGDLVRWPKMSKCLDCLYKVSFENERSVKYPLLSKFETLTKEMVAKNCLPTFHHKKDICNETFTCLFSNYRLTPCFNNINKRNGCFCAKSLQ